MLASWAITPLILSELPASQITWRTEKLRRLPSGSLATADSRTTKLYDRRGQKVLLEDMETDSVLKPRPRHKSDFGSLTIISPSDHGILRILHL
jgi:hypothetical protein